MITAKDEQHHVIDTHAIGILPGLFEISDDTVTTTATITKNQDDFYKMTLEEQMQQYDDTMMNSMQQKIW